MNDRTGGLRGGRVKTVAKRLSVLALALAVSGSRVNAQSLAEGGDRATFEVASVKRSGPTSQPGLDYSPAGRFTATAMTLKRLIMWAYNLGTRDVSGGPSWIGDDKYDVIAKVPTGSITGPVGNGMQLGG